MLPNPASSVDSVAHIIQVALTPVFLLSGIGTLLNVFNLRLSRVSDHAEHAAELLRGDPSRPEAGLLRAHLRRLHNRTVALDVAIALAALGGACACGAAFALFVVTVREQVAGTVLIALFGTSLGCTVGALGAFIADSVLAWHGLQREGRLPRAHRSG